MQTVQQITPEFKKAAVEVARLFDLADVETWEDLPDGVRGFMSHVEYKALVVPLVYQDRCNMSWQALSIKYQLSVREVRTICQKAYFRANVRRKGKTNMYE